MNVARLLAGVHSLGFMRKFILDRNYRNVFSAWRLLENGLTVVLSKDAILERNFTNGMSV